ncbi:MAG: LptF/LptG family permease [Sulfurovaceae bacterium]|nr:LptF/LptG family permease [Sulfurovaceae bacterium]
MKLYQLYIAKYFLKNFIVILLGMTIMFVLINYLTYGSRINGAFNQKISYMFYSWEHSLSILYPLALVFGVITTKIQLVKSNTMGALYSFGYTNKRLLLPILIITTLIYVIFIFLQTTSFAYAKDDADSFIGNGGKVKAAEKLFLKYNNTYIYIDKLDQANKKIYGLSLFEVENNKIKYTMKSPVGIYNGSSWTLKDAVMKTNYYENEMLTKYSTAKYTNFNTLDGYKPIVIDSVGDNGGSMKLGDAYETYKLLANQNIDTTKIRASVYSKTILPMFIFGLIVLIFFKIPYLVRYENMTKIASIAIAASLLIWASFTGINFFGSNGVVLPEIASFVPIIILSIIGLKSYFSKEILV